MNFTNSSIFKDLLANSSSKLLGLIKTSYNEAVGLSFGEQINHSSQHQGYINTCMVFYLVRKIK